MWLLRLLAVLLVVGVGVCGVLYILTGDRRYLGYAWRGLQAGVIFALLVFALLVFALMFVERLAIIPA